MMPTQNYPERNYQDIQRWNPLVGKMFYQTSSDPDKKDMFRTIRMHYNIFADKITPQISNWISGIPPEGMKEINPRLLSSLTTHQNHSSNGFY
jgi:hypothetical protein